MSNRITVGLTVLAVLVVFVAGHGLYRLQHPEPEVTFDFSCPSRPQPDERAVVVETTLSAARKITFQGPPELTEDLSEFGIVQPRTDGSRRDGYELIVDRRYHFGEVALYIERWRSCKIWLLSGTDESPDVPTPTPTATPAPTPTPICDPYTIYLDDDHPCADPPMNWLDCEQTCKESSAVAVEWSSDGNCICQTLGWIPTLTPTPTSLTEPIDSDFWITPIPLAEIPKSSEALWKLKHDGRCYLVPECVFLKEDWIDWGGELIPFPTTLTWPCLEWKTEVSCEDWETLVEIIQTVPKELATTPWPTSMIKGIITATPTPTVHADHCGHPPEHHWELIDDEWTPIIDDPGDCRWAFYTNLKVKVADCPYPWCAHEPYYLTYDQYWSMLLTNPCEWSLLRVEIYP